MNVFRACIFVSNLERYVFRFVNVQNSSTWGRKYRPQAVRYPSLPLSETDVTHVIKWTRPSPSVFAYCKLLKTGWWEGLGMRLT